MSVISHSYSEQLSHDFMLLQKWKAGKQVSMPSIEKYGIDKCFSVSNIDDAIFQRINGNSYKNNSLIAITDLCYIKVLHFDITGTVKIGEIICNKKISKDLLEIFKVLFNAGYPIEKIILVDEYNADDEISMSANNTSAFNYRTIAGTAKISQHALGLAIDINPLYNPYVRMEGQDMIVSPESAFYYVDREKEFPYKIDTSDLCYKEFVKRGFVWGGDWELLKDYQHFEKKI